MSSQPNTQGPSGAVLTDDELCAALDSVERQSTGGASQLAGHQNLQSTYHFSNTVHKFQFCM
jgi:hypothetical protein